MSVKHHGRCHCGSLRWELTSELDLEPLTARFCGCSFCEKHTPAWYSNPSSSLTISADTAPIRYRFGTGTADFVFCSTCGALAAAMSRIDDQDYGIVNLKTLSPSRRWNTPPEKSDFEAESKAERLNRRSRNWMPVSLAVP